MTYPATATIRRYVDADFRALVAGWHATNRAAYGYVEAHQRHTQADAERFFSDCVLPCCSVWVAERAGRLCGLIALEAPWIRQLAVFVEEQRTGVGTALLMAARAASPHELRLFTFARNVPARSFYARHGFVAVAFGTSPPPESEPDVEMRWVG